MSDLVELVRSIIEGIERGNPQPLLQRSRIESNGTKRRTDRIGRVWHSWEEKPSWRMCSPEFSTTFRISA